MWRGLTSSPNDVAERGSFVSAEENADVAVVVVTYNSAADIDPLIDDLRIAAASCRIRVIVVDNQSSDNSAELIRAHPDVMLIEPGWNLSYAGGINVGLPHVGQCHSVLILNPDLRLRRGAVDLMFGALDDPRVGAVVPTILNADGTLYHSLRYEPSLVRAFGDALAGGHFQARPGILSETDFRPASYAEAHDVDWATGAVLLVRSSLVRELGEWNEEFFLYSEETDYFRRVREHGMLVRFEPAATAMHSKGGSGRSLALAALLVVNRVRYAERHHGWIYAVLYRAAVALSQAVRSYDPEARWILAHVVNRKRWDTLPRVIKPAATEKISGPRNRGSVIVPSYNEAAVIERTLAHLSPLAVDGYLELIVVCNGCVDNTADIARRVPGVRVIELEVGSKPAALNAGDEAATLWPRLYLDADIAMSPVAALAVLDRLAQGDILAARPAFRYDTTGASWLVRSYYRARQRIPQFKRALWGAGVYGLSQEGHQRLGVFPNITGDDLFVDTLFDSSQKVVVPTEPSVVRTPADAKSLLAILRRNLKAGTEDLQSGHGPAARTSPASVRALVRSIRGPRSAFDVAVYAAMALVARRPGARNRGRWERDESSRLNP